jgi:methionyl-tRNA formyltransferase
VLPRLVYLGTPAMSVPPLRALAEAGFEIPLVVSATDKRRGRGSGLAPSPVKAAALELGIPVTDRVVEAVDAGADLGVVVAFGKIIKPDVLERLPMVNLHFSLLPRWRGAAPVERAILAGDDETGVDLMAVEEGLDTGGIYDRAVVGIGPDEPADELRARLVVLGTRLLVDNLRRGIGEPVPQIGEPTYAHKIDPELLHIDWSQPAIGVHRLARVGGAWTTHEGKRLKVWRTAVPPRDGAVTVRAGDGPVELVEVQPEGKPRMEARAWANGARWREGDPLGT